MRAIRGRWTGLGVVVHRRRDARPRRDQQPRRPQRRRRSALCTGRRRVLRAPPQSSRHLSDDTTNRGYVVAGCTRLRRRRRRRRGFFHAPLDRYRRFLARGDRKNPRGSCHGSDLREKKGTTATTTRMIDDPLATERPERGRLITAWIGSPRGRPDRRRPLAKRRTTSRVDAAVGAYVEACGAATAAARRALRALSREAYSKI